MGDMDNIDVTVLRLGHRIVRDQRISTHVGLTARALGARKIVFAGEEDKGLLETISSISRRFGGGFEAEYTRTPLKLLRHWDGISVHLTMYGIEAADAIPRVHESISESGDNRLLVIVGGAKVPGEVFDLATFNVSVGNQPHSEVAALAIFLDRLFDGRSRLHFYEDAEIQVIPDEHEKHVKRLTS